MYIIGLDVGTTGTKAALLDEKGTVLAKGYKEYELVTGEDRRVEQSAEDWWNAAVYAIRKATEKIDPKEVRAIGLSTQGSTQVPVDKDFRPLAPAMTWMDKRAAKEGEAINRALGGPDGDGVYRKTGWGTGPSTDSSKILWIRANKKEIYDKTAYFVSTVEFMNHRLTGRNIIDPTNGTIRGLINATSGDYDEDILSFLQIGRDRLPEILPTGALVGNLTSEAAAATGLSTECEVFNGAHDQYCASLGSGTVDKGDMLIATGTTWVIFGIADKLMFCPSRIATGIHPVKGRYGALASMVSVVVLYGVW